VGDEDFILSTQDAGQSMSRNRWLPYIVILEPADSDAMLPYRVLPL